MNDISTTFKEEYVYLDVDKLEMDDFFQQDVEVTLDDFILQENDNLTEIQEEVEVQVDTEKLDKNREHNSYNNKESNDTTDDRLSFFFTLILILCMFMLIPLLMVRAKEATRDLTDTLEELSQPKIEMNID